MAPKRKMDAKTFAGQKRKSRKWLTFMRMVRYGVSNFSRNAWLTIAATAVMTITLLIVFMTFAARNILADTVTEIQSKVDMSIYVKTNVSQDAVDKMKNRLQSLSSVVKVEYVSPDDARKDFARLNSGDEAALKALNQADNKFPGTFRVGIKNINDTRELDQFVKNDSTYQQNKDANRAPSFAGERRQAIQAIGQGVGFAEKLGIVASVIFSVISSLIIFNTIRMAIFNRKEEIQMMKLIGADRSFIRGPFIVEAIVYGFIAAIIATILGTVILMYSKDTLLNYGIAIEKTIEVVTIYIPFVLLGMLVLGALIGIISSLLATRKYLKL